MLPKDIREKVMGLLNNKHYKPIKREEFIKIFAETPNDSGHLDTILEEMNREGEIFINKKDKIGSLNTYNMKKGKFRSTKRGFGFVEDGETEEDIFVSEKDKGSAFNGDTVLVKIIEDATYFKNAEGVIVKILKRENESVIGVFKSSKSFGFVVVDDKKFNQDIFVPKRYFSGARDNDKVVVKIDTWPDGDKKPEGRIVEVIGKVGERYVEIDSIVKKHGMMEEFPQKVLDQLDTIADKVSKDELSGRVDLRDEQIYTIDGDDSKDFDDAIDVSILANGNYSLGVHIADVTHYVKEGSPLDKEALSRATSVYLVDKVVPMLPKKLSNGICSLNPGLDRLTLSCIMEVNSQNGRVEKYDIIKSVIHSKARMTYTEISDLLEKDDEAMKEKYVDFLENLEHARDLAEILNKRRQRRGAIDFDFTESKIKLDEDGIPIKIEEYERRISNRMIEEFMLLANETIAEHFFWLKSPFVYRVHEDPEEEKVESLRGFINEYGISMQKSRDGLKPRNLQKVLSSIEDKEVKQAIATIMLRTLRQARYTSDCLGHFGLAAQYYTHFTSPIRRYPDLQIHRIIKEHIEGSFDQDRDEHYRSILEEVAKQSSTQEREAQLAEREVDDYYKAVYMERYIGKKFKGHISSVTGFGMFVELANGVEGLIRLESLYDYYEYYESSMTLVGECTGKVYRLGQKVDVVLDSVNVANREINFRLA